MTQERLDEMSATLARLDLDSCLIVAVNALAQHREPTPMQLMSRIAKVMIGASTVIGDDAQHQCISLLRSVADHFETALAETSSLRILN
jgi:hypothetical protein